MDQNLPPVIKKKNLNEKREENFIAENRRQNIKRGAVAMRYFPSKRRILDRLNIKTNYFWKPIFQRRNLVMEIVDGRIQSLGLREF